MNRFLSVILLVLIACFAANARKKLANQKRCTNGFCVNVKGQSGKISVWQGKKEGSATDALSFEMDYIKELSSDGSEVGDNLSKDKKHSYNTFAVLDFLFSDVYETTVKGAKADAFNFTANIPGPNATLLFEMFFIKENKTISLCDGSEYTMRNGSIKFNIEVKGWNFCGYNGMDCGKKGGSDVKGAYVELATLVKAPKDKEPKDDKDEKAKGKKEKGKRLIVDNMVVKLPDAVDADGSCSKLADGYPTFKLNNKKQITTFRFQKFNSKVIYDPIIEDYDENDPSSSTTTASLSLLVATIAALVMLFV